MQKYTFVKLLEDVSDGYEFPATNWPLHLTLVDDFYINKYESKMQEKLKTLLADQPAVKIIAQNDDLFGPSKDIAVTTLKITPELMLLHIKLIAFLKSLRADFVSPEFYGEGYKPHVTVQAKHRVNTGDQITINAISIVDMNHNEDMAQRKILYTIKLQ